jgi:thioredoxin reductase
MSEIKPQEREYLIVGAGPAGLQMGYFLKQLGRDFLILESGGSAGTFFKTFPRHRKLISINKTMTGIDDPELNLRWDWNSLLSEEREPRFTSYSRNYFPNANDFVHYLNDFAMKFDLPIVYGSHVVRISQEKRFVLRDMAGRRYTTERLVIATGLCKQVLPDFPGANYAEPYESMSINPQDFHNQRVMIIGKGNSGFETADNLIETTATIHLLSPSPVRMAWKTHYVGDLRAVNNDFLDTYQLKSQNTVLDARIEWVQPKENRLEVGILYTHANDERRIIPVDRLVACTGFAFDPTPFDESCSPMLTPNKKYPVMTAAWESVNIPRMYFAGTLMHMRDYRRTFSGFIHGFRYNIRALAQILAIRHHEGAWPIACVPTAPELLLNDIVQRVHANSALFQQPGFLCDAIVLTPGLEARYYKDVPVAMLQELGISGNPHLRLTMEYGHQDYPDSFNIERFPGDGDRSHFIHPVVRYSDGNGTEAEHHVPEDLENDWRKPQFLDPLLAFLKSKAGASPNSPIGIASSGREPWGSSTIGVG